MHCPAACWCCLLCCCLSQDNDPLDVLVLMQSTVQPFSFMQVGSLPCIVRHSQRAAAGQLCGGRTAVDAGQLNGRAKDWQKLTKETKTEISISGKTH